MNELPYWSSFAAAVISGAAFLYVAFRGSLNALSVIFATMFACLCEWNLLEWLRLDRQDESLLPLVAIGFTLLPVPYLHFALLMDGRTRRFARWLVLPYLGAAALLVPAVGAPFDATFLRIFLSDAWNTAFIAFFAPLLVLANLLLFVAWRRAPRSRRPLVGMPLCGGVILGVTGFSELAVPLGLPVPKLANLGGALAAILFATSLVRYREVFDALARMRTSTENLLEAMDRGVATFDASGRAVFVNRHVARLLGARPETADDLPAPARSLFPAGGHCHFRTSERVIRVTVTPTDAEVKEIAQTHLVAEDVTREYALMREAAREEGLAALGQAAATFAHEIRNSMTTLHAAIENTPPDSPPGAALRGSARRLDDLVSRALDLARPLQLDPVDCDVDVLMREVAGRVGAPRVRLHLAGDLPQVRADPDLLAQVIVNLVRNAGEAGAGSVDVGTARRDGRVVIEVANRGPRIPAVLLARVFEPFVTTKPGGTGLGLAVCRKIVTAHGGEIRVTNAEDGVRCEVELPSTC